MKSSLLRRGRLKLVRRSELMSYSPGGSYAKFKLISGFDSVYRQVFLLLVTGFVAYRRDFYSSKIWLRWNRSNT